MQVRSNLPKLSGIVDKGGDDMFPSNFVNISYIDGDIRIPT